MKGKNTLCALVLAGAIPCAAIAADKAMTQSQKPASEDSVVSMFTELDADKNGTISKDEAKRSADVQARFEQLDANHDGVISLQEWKGEKPKAG